MGNIGTDETDWTIRYNRGYLFSHFNIFMTYLLGLVRHPGLVPPEWREDLFTKLGHLCAETILTSTVTPVEDAGFARALHFPEHDCTESD